MTLRARGALSRNQRLFRWWYITIGLGFFLLAIRAFVAGDALWSVLLRVVIAAGFWILGALWFRTPQRR